MWKSTLSCVLLFHHVYESSCLLYVCSFNDHGLTIGGWRACARMARAGRRSPPPKRVGVISYSWALGPGGRLRGSPCTARGGRLACSHAGEFFFPLLPAGVWADELPGGDSPAAYRYTAQLLALARCTPLTARELPVSLREIITPLHWPAWEVALRGHPDREFAGLIVSGIRQGFPVGFDSTSSGPIAETWVRPMTIPKSCPTTWRTSAPIAASWGRWYQA